MHNMQVIRQEHSPRLNLIINTLLPKERNIKNMGIDQSLCNMSSFEHKCLNNIKKIYQHAGEYDDQKKP